jgi:uncharacterized protein (TIGR03790 family)
MISSAFLVRAAARAAVLLLPVLAAAAAPAGEADAAPPAAISPPENLRPEEVAVLANRAVEDSLRVARHYMERRGIPAANLFTIDYPEFGELDPQDNNPRWYSFDRFRTDVVEPLEAFLQEGDRPERILCLVTVYGMPYRVGGFELTAREHAGLRLAQSIPEAEAFREAGRAERRRLLEKRARRLWLANSAFDSELAWRFRSPPPPRQRRGYGRRRRLQGRAGNPYFGKGMPFRRFRRRQLAGSGPDRLYLVARLDGLSAENAMGLVDKALTAEREGVSGTACFDSRNEGPNTEGYNLGDWWIRLAWEITRKAGLPTKRHARPGMFEAGACPETLIYWGFYHPFDYRGAIFDHAFPPGAIACHIASFEAANIRRPLPWNEDGKKQGPWCSGFLGDGVTVTIGPVAEPYLQAFPHTQHFFPRLYAGWSVGEAYWASIDNTSWRLILVGDPLYAPFAADPPLPADAPAQ